MSIQPDSLAKATGAGVKNSAFKQAVTVLPRKVLVFGVFDPSKAATVTEDVPVQVNSPEDAGSKFGFGFMIERLVRRVFVGTKGDIPVYVSPQAEDGGAVQASGNVDFAGSAGVKAGDVKLYIAGDLVVNFTVADADDEDAIAIKCAAAVNAIKELPVTAAVDGVTTSQVNFTAKSGGTWGNDISIAFNLEVGDELPTGVTAAVVDMSGGLTVPSIANALSALGDGTDANADYFTDVVHGYQLDSTTLDAFSAYVGEGDEFSGLYDKLVARPFRVFTGDVTAGTAGLDALIVISDDRLTDRGNGVIPVPGSPSHPSEIAANTVGYIARINNVRAEESYEDGILEAVRPGDKADRWTADYTNGRDKAVKNGISTTKVKNGVVTLQDVITFYRPESVPVDSNGYRSARDISITQNVLYSTVNTFNAEKWKGISIVEDVTKVTNPDSKIKARDINSIRQELVQLVSSWAQRAWLYNDTFSINELKKEGSIVIRPGGKGFDFTLRVVYSGEGGIINGTIEFDISLAIVLG